MWVGLDHSRFESSRRGSASGRIIRITQNILQYVFNPRIRPTRFATSEDDMSFLFPDTQDGGGCLNDGWQETIECEVVEMSVSSSNVLHSRFTPGWAWAWRMYSKAVRLGLGVGNAYPI